MAGPSGLKITAFITMQAPKRLRIFYEMFNRYLLVMTNHKYAYLQKLHQALDIRDSLKCSQSIMFEKKQRNAIISSIAVVIS